ncbi:MAG: hypothetical protein WBY96_09750, partial [Candidatus Sulfotelmatobacter sp.]
MAAGGGVVCGLAGLGWGVAGFAGELTDFESTPEGLSAVPLTAALPGPLPAAEPPDAGFCATFFGASPLADCVVTVAPLAAADPGAGFETNLATGAAAGLAAAFGCGFAPGFPAEAGAATVAG